MNDVAMIKAPVGGEVEPLRPAPDDPILSAILMAARDPQVDMEKLGALKAMYAEERAYRAELAFSEAMQEAQSEMEPVVRDKANDQTKSNYATISALAKAITPIYTKHGFAMTFDQGETSREGHLRVNGELRHRGGHTTKHFADIPVDKTGIAGKVNKTDTHAFGSTMSYGRRYLTLLIWNIATHDDDGNAASAPLSGEAASPKDVMEMRESLTFIRREEQKFLNYINNRLKLSLETLDALPVEHTEAVRGLLSASVNAEKARRDKETRHDQSD